MKKNKAKFYRSPGSTSNGNLIPGIIVGQDRAGAAHTFLEQNPYKQFASVKQAAPKGSPLTLAIPWDEAVRLEQREFESPTTPTIQLIEEKNK